MKKIARRQQQQQQQQQEQEQIGGSRRGPSRGGRLSNDDSEGETLFYLILHYITLHHCMFLHKIYGLIEQVIKRSIETLINFKLKFYLLRNIITDSALIGK